MKKKKMLMFPGMEKFDINSINTHAKVCSFFLSKSLSKYYDVAGTVGWDTDADFIKAVKDNDPIAKQAALSNSLANISMENCRDVDYIFTTIQRGFSKIYQRSGAKFVDSIRKRNKNVKLCSIQDHYGTQKFIEDFLFTSLEANSAHIRNIKKSSINKNIDVGYLGWCAEHTLLENKSLSNKDFNVMLDHSALQDFRADATQDYIDALKKLKHNYKAPRINVCRINDGFEFYDFKKNAWSRDLRLRWWHSAYDNDPSSHVFKIIEGLNASDIFCVTHVESCGLTGIEAQMAGCKLYIPRGKDKFISWGRKGNDNIGKFKNVHLSSYDGAFIKEALLRPYMNYSIFNNDAGAIYKEFERDINKGYRINNREMLIANHSWDAAAARIKKSLEKR